jgi:imidazolonepropionase-like amidohydrolase
MLRAPELLYTDPDLITNVDASIRKRLYLALRFLRLPGVPRVLMGQARAMERWELWRRESLSNTRRLYDAGAHLIFGTDTPFAFGNFFHSIMNEIRGLKEAGLPNVAILRMATIDAARALNIDDRLGTVERGKVADAVLVRGNPVENIEALASVEIVLKEGRIVYDVGRE